jgi:uncharacterized protein DUF6484
MMIISPDDVPTVREEQADSDPFRPLVTGRAAVTTGSGPHSAGVIVGELVAITNDGHTPLVIYPGQPGTAAIPARSTVDLHGSHISRQVVLAFEDADPGKPIVMGVLGAAEDGLRHAAVGQVEVESDGKRVIVDAKEQLVLRCGKASIILTKTGKVLIQGAYVSNRSSGVLRLKGGSVNIN